MTKRAEERQRLQHRRLEREEHKRERQRRLLLLGGGGAAILAIALVAVLILISESSDRSGGSVEGAAEVTRHLKRVPQRGDTLGRNSAPVTVVEFGDLQCPVCKAYSTSVIAPLIEGPVRAGRAKLEFRNWAILGAQSVDAGAAALAAGEQGRHWSFVELFYRNQGIEGSGYVTDEFLRSVAEGAGVPDLARWERDRASSRWTSVLRKVDSQAQSFGLTGTPSFLVIGPNGTQTLGTPHSVSEIEAAIATASDGSLGLEDHQHENGHD
jgi:protein-disulfide isomerase